MRSSSEIEVHARASTPVPVRAIRLRPRDWFDLVVASVELGIARVRIALSDQSSLLRPTTAADAPGTAEQEPVERVRVAIARTSHRVPWRADCLVQAIAARHWLSRLGVETSLCIGVPEAKGGQFEAHAWLMHGEKVITGGDINGYISILDSTAATRGRAHKS